MRIGNPRPSIGSAFRAAAHCRAPAHRHCVLPAAALLALLALLVLPWGASAWAAPGDLTVRGSYLLQRVTFDFGYGAWLRERFGARSVDLAGPALSAVYQTEERLGWGLEVERLQGGFPYHTLNGEPRRVDFTLQQVLLKLHAQWPESWELGLGLGNNVLTRSLEGFQSADIGAANVAANRGVADAKTYGSVALAEVLYKRRGPRLGLEAGLRYAVSLHRIGAEDRRPALDDAQRPVGSWFSVGGFSYLFTALVVF